MTPTMQAAPPVESAPLSDEAILGIEPESPSSPDAYDSPDATNASDANFDFASRDSDDAPHDRAARGRERDRHDASQRDANGAREGNRPAREDDNAQREDKTAQRDAKDDQRTAERDAAPKPDANTPRTLPLGSLAEFDAGFYSGDAASRTALAQSLFASDPAAFRAMFDEAARLLGVSAARTNAADGDGHVAEAFRPPAFPAQNQDGGLKASATQIDRGARDENDRNAATRNSANAARTDTAPPAQFPAESYRAFEVSTNEAVARDVRGAITRTLEQVLPEGVAEGAAKRIGEDIFGEVGKLLAADAQLSSQVGETLRGWRFGPAEQQQVASLLSGRARQILPSVARRVIGEWTNSVLATARTRATRSEAAARRVDVGGASSGDAASRGAGRPLKPRDIDYARTSDDDIFAM